MSDAKIGFQMQIIRLLLENILPVRQISDAQKKANRYEIILASIKAVGLVEPLVVFPLKGQPGKYTLVNGHMRYYAMKQLETAHTYVKTLLKNSRIAKYLKGKHAEISTEFENMAAAEPV